MRIIKYVGVFVIGYYLGAFIVAYNEIGTPSGLKDANERALRWEQRNHVLKEENRVLKLRIQTYQGGEL